MFFLCAASTPVLFAIENEIKKGNYTVLLALLIPLSGLFLIKKAWKATKEWRHFGEIELEMDPFPGAIGGHVGGSFLLKNIYDYSTKYKVLLECVHNSASRDNSSRESIKWAEGGYAKVKAAAQSLQLNFRFDVPENLPEADIEQSGAFYFWRLKLSSQSSAISLSRDYNIPVFKTGKQSKNIVHNISEQAEENRENKALETQVAIGRGDFASTPLARALINRDKGNETKFYFPMFRNKFLSLFALVFVGGFSFATYSIYQSLGDGGFMDIFLLLFSLPFAIVGFLASIATIYLPLNNLSVTLTTKKIKAVRRLFIFPIKSDLILSSEVNKIEVKSTGSTGQGASQIKHFKLIAHTKKYKQVTIAEDIDGEDLANQLKQFIFKRLYIKC